MIAPRARLGTTVAPTTAMLEVVLEVALEDVALLWPQMPRRVWEGLHEAEVAMSTSSPALTPT